MIYSFNELLYNIRETLCGANSEKYLLIMTSQ